MEISNDSFAAARTLIRYGLLSCALVVALTLYCELCGIVLGYEVPALEVSLPWAVQVAAGWILIGAALGRFGAQALNSAFASRHPRSLLLVAVAGIACFAIACELLLSRLADDPSPALALIARRAPWFVAASALLVSVFVVQRLFGNAAQNRTSTVRESAAAEATSSTGAGHHELDSLEVMTGTGHATIRTAEIEYLQADGNYVNVFHCSGRSYLLRQTMTGLERSLDPRCFQRIHRSTIVNLSLIKERRTSRIIVLQSGRTVRIGRAFQDRLDSLCR